MDYLKNFFPIGANSVVVDTLSRFLLAFDDSWLDCKTILDNSLTFKV